MNQPLDLDAIEARANAATPGPWNLSDDLEDDGYPGHLWVVRTPASGPDEPDEHCAVISIGDRALGEFIAAMSPETAKALVAEVRRLRAELADFSGRVNELESKLCDCEPVREHDDYKRPAFYQHEPHCPVTELDHADTQPATERRTLTESEHDRAWHAIEGAAGEEGADPGTVLNAVLRALDLNPPAEPPHVRAARYAAAGNEMAASLVRDGFGDDEIAEIQARPAARP